MPSHANDELKARHKCFVASTGGGKTYKVKELLAQNPKANVVVYDPYQTYGDILTYAETVRELAWSNTWRLGGW